MPGTGEERVALALAALAEVTDPEDVGALLDAEVVEPGVVDLRFACNLPGYAAWHWTVSTTDLPDADPTVLEVELLPGDDALLAPPWVPWTERLAEWRRQHPDEEHPGQAEAEDDESDDVAEVEDDEDGDLDEDDLAVDDDVLDEVELEDPDEAPADRAGDDEGRRRADAPAASDDEDDEDDDGFRDEEPEEPASDAR